MKALRRNFPAFVVNRDFGELIFCNGCGKPSDLALDDMLPNMPVKISTCPFYFNVYNSVQNSIDFLNHNRELRNIDKK